LPEELVRLAAITGAVSAHTEITAQRGGNRTGKKAQRRCGR
jgi:hypothetical protein